MEDATDEYGSPMIIKHYKSIQSPTKQPTRNPTLSPTFQSTCYPSKSPTKQPTKHTTLSPTFQPTFYPSKSPTLIPTNHPTFSPTQSPTQKAQPQLFITHQSSFVAPDYHTIPRQMQVTMHQNNGSNMTQIIAQPTLSPTQIPTQTPTRNPLKSRSTSSTSSNSNTHTNKSPPKTKVKKKCTITKSIASPTQQPTPSPMQIPIVSNYKRDKIKQLIARKQKTIDDASNVKSRAITFHRIKDLKEDFYQIFKSIKKPQDMIFIVDDIGDIDQYITRKYKFKQILTPRHIAWEHLSRWFIFFSINRND